MQSLARRAQTILRQYGAKTRRMKQIQNRIDHLRDNASRATSTFTAGNISGTSGRSRVESAMVKAIDLENQLLEILEDVSAQRYRIQAAVNNLEDDTEKSILEMRYIDQKPWPQITEALHISEATSYRIHEQALISFWRAYNRRQEKKPQPGQE